MNNRGWGLQAMIGMICLLMLALVVIAIIINSKLSFLFDTTAVTYTDLEIRVEESLKQYKDKYYSNLDNGEAVNVKVSTLEHKGLLASLTDAKKNKCTGYGKISKENNAFSYDAYIKCGSDYQTEKYNPELD